MIKAIILAVLSATNVPFMTKHRTVVPETVVTTNFFGSVTGIVDNAYIAAHGGGGGGTGGLDTNAVIRLAGSGLFTNGLAASYIRQSNNCRDYNSFCGPTHFIGGIHTWNTNVVKFTKSDTGSTSTLKPDGTPVLTEGFATNFVKTIAEDSSVTNAGAVAESKAYTDACCSTLAVASTNISYKAITNSVTSGYLCTVAAAQAMTNAVTFAQLKSKPTTLAGYGITDAYTKTDSDSTFLPATRVGEYDQWRVDGEIDAEKIEVDIHFKANGTTIDQHGINSGNNDIKAYGDMIVYGIKVDPTDPQTGVHGWVDISDKFASKATEATVAALVTTTATHTANIGAIVTTQGVHTATLATKIDAPTASNVVTDIVTQSFIREKLVNYIYVGEDGGIYVHTN